MNIRAGSGTFIRWATVAAVVGLAGVAVAAPQISVSPTNLAWTSNAWVNVTVSNLAAGAEVKLALFVDVQGNGVVDEGQDTLIAAYRVQDGRTNWLGSSIIVDDEDGAANGTLAGRFAYFGEEGPLHVVGNYLWLAKTVSGGTTTVARFAVTQPTGTVWITGTVVDGETDSPIPAAVVEMECFADVAMPAAWTASDGTFKLYLPSGVSTADVQWIGAMGPGYSSLDGAGQMVAGYEFTQNLQAGENALPEPLRLGSPDADDLYEVSGHVYDHWTNAIPGVLVNIEWGGDDEDEGWAVGITDTNGFYRLCVPAIEEAELYTDPSSMMHIGLIAVGRGVSVAGDVADVDLFCPPATLLVRGRVLAEDNDEPVAGALVSLSGQGFGSVGVSLADGGYEVGAIPYENYSAEVDEVPEGFLGGPELEGLAITDNSVTNLDFHVQRGHVIAGVVYDAQTNTLSGGLVGAHSYPDWYGGWQYDVGVNRQGAYRLLAPAGTFAVEASGFAGYIAQTYAGRFSWEWGDNGRVADPVVNPPGGTNGIDFHLLQAAQIQGVVRGNGDPVEGVEVTAYERGEDYWSWINRDYTDANGAYSIDVPPGSNYMVEVWIPEREGFFWLPQYYDHVSDDSEAAWVTTDLGAPATNIDFDLDEGGIISGHVYEDDGETPVPWCWLIIETPDGEYVDGCGTDDDGYFEAIVPAGEYRVLAECSHASYGVDLYYDGWYRNEREQANVVTAFVAQVTGNIDFVMIPGGTISGRVTEKDGSTPVPWCWVEAQIDGQGMGDGQADEDGYYWFRVPPGTYVVEARPDWDDQPYARQFYSNTSSSAEATPVTVASEGEVQNVDFWLGQGGSISGRVYADDGGAGVGGCHVYAEDYDSGNWVDGTDADGSGYYTLRVPAGQYRVRANPDPNHSWLIGEWYADTMDYSAAASVDVEDDSDTPDIDFGLALGFGVQGRVTDAGGNPIASAWLDAHSVDEYNWNWGGSGSTDQDGYYRMALPATTSYFVRLPHQDGTWYPDTFYSNAFRASTALLLTAAPGEVIENVDFQVAPGFRVWGHVYASDGATPIPYAYVHGYGDDTLPYGDTGTDEHGAYSLFYPTNRLIVLRADAGGYRGEVYDQQYDPLRGTFLNLPAGASTNADFALYGEWQDTDDDGVFDWDEDSVPDGVYVPGEDWASFLKRDTDDDGFPDGDENVARTDPADAQSLLRLIEARREGDRMVVTWQSIPGRTYELYALDELPGVTDWNYLDTIVADGDTAIFTNTSPPECRFYRVVVQP